MKKYLRWGREAKIEQMNMLGRKPHVGAIGSLQESLQEQLSNC